MALTSGIFEGFGISTVIPLLDFLSDAEKSNKYSLVVFGFLEFIGLSVSLRNILLLLILFFSLKAIFIVFQAVYSPQLLTTITTDLKNDFCIKVANVKYGYFSDKPLGFFNNILTTEINSTISGLNNYLRVIICIIYIGIYLFYAYLINAKLTLFVFALSIIIFFSLRKMNQYLQKLSFHVSRTNAEIQSLTIQKLYNFKYLKATGSFKPILDQIFKKIEENRKYHFKTQVLNAVPPSFVEVFSIVFLSGLVWYYVGLHNRQIGEILVLLIFFWRALTRILNFQNWWLRFCSFAGAINVVNDAYKDLDQNTEKFGTVTIPKLKNKIELQNIAFSYNSKKVIDNVNIIIPKGKSIGIVGPSGAGKTTLFDLLVGLFSPKSGVIKIDDTRYQDIDLKDLRLNIGYVTQEPVIFNDTIANNISLWNYKNRDLYYKKRIRRAAELSNCSSFIEECENSYDTILGDKGAKLSGGQRQRIAIAREIFKNPQIIIFDEATSALDAESEQLIQQSIKSMKDKYTLVIIAHRLSTIINCDFIYVLEKGHIVESGTYEELYAKDGGVFKKMCREQAI